MKSIEHNYQLPLGPIDFADLYFEKRVESHPPVFLILCNFTRGNAAKSLPALRS